MAKDKKSLFEWLTGGSGNDNDYSFDDLESGGSSSFNREREQSRKVAPSRGSMQEDAPELPEEDVDGELAVDVYETPTHILIKAMIAGVKPEDLDVSITRDMVTVRGKRERAVESNAGDHFFQELYWGSFSRTIMLPQEVEIEEAEATEKHGLLIIKLPKLDKGRHAKLKVKSN